MAALFVVCFHLWPGQIRGGFAGVDVFFVISGFLITGHLARELATDGTVRLPAFYARRARRLLPAALTVLLASAVGVFAVLPMTVWQRSFQEIAASALYFENWSLAAGSVDYFAAEDPPTLVQHYWSLSVEEQFYLVWPLLFLLAAMIARRVPTSSAGFEARRRLVLGAFPALALIISFGWSALHHGSGAEYFSTFTRAWEFAAGGLLALVAGSGRPGLVGRSGFWTTSVSWVGWAAVLGSGLLLSETLRFPGWVAVIPVLGTVAVIAAGMTSERFGPDRLVSNRVVQYIGGISYSLYLWHWPVIILFGREPGGIENNGTNRFVLLGASVLLAIASTYLIEAPIRRGAWTSRGASSRRGASNGQRASSRFRTARTLGLAAVGMAVVFGVTLYGQARVESAQDDAQRQIEAIQKNPPQCFGAAALDPRLRECATQADDDAKTEASRSRAAEAGRLLIPSPLAAFDDKPKTCMQSQEKAALRVCTTGAKVADATRQVAVIGDSHAMAWMPAVQQVARERGWRLYALLKGSCPLIEAVRVIDPASAASCVTWNDAVQSWLTKHPEIDQVIVTASSKNEFVPDSGRTWQETAVRGYLQAWDELPDTVTKIVVLRDVPRPRPDVVACSQTAVSAGHDVRECGRAEDQALLDDPEVQAAAQSDRSPKVIDLTRYFCADDYCSPGIGGAFVYRDGHHLTATFSRTLAPYLAASLRP